MPDFISTPALEVIQPLGVFYAAVIPASVLLEVTYSNPLKVTGPGRASSLYPLAGAQRAEREDRLKEIGRFVNTTEAAFPNSIILAANYTQDGTELSHKSAERWRVEKRAGHNSLVVPSKEKLATIVDGQHRLHAFEFASDERQKMPLLCSVYLDLPNAFQAYLFATINFNQKKVDRSLAYELFGFNVEEEPANSWSPDKAAVFLCRKLNTDKESSLRGRIIVVAENADELFGGKWTAPDWRVSTATVVDGILSLISSNPRRDRDELHKSMVGPGRQRKILPGDAAPLRALYLAGNDLAVYTAVKNYFKAVEETLWNHAENGSFIVKTVGIQALFDVLRWLLNDFDKSRDLSAAHFKKLLRSADKVNFAGEFFHASGHGRTRIKNVLLLAMRQKTIDEVPAGDREEYAKAASG